MFLFYIRFNFWCAYPFFFKQKTCTYDYKTRLQWMKLVDRLVLVSPLQVQQDLLDQRQTVAIRNVQLLHLVNAIFLNKQKQHAIFKRRKICIYEILFKIKLLEDLLITTSTVMSYFPQKNKRFECPCQLIMITQPMKGEPVVWRCLPVLVTGWTVLQCPPGQGNCCAEHHTSHSHRCLGSCWCRSVHSSCRSPSPV